MANTQDAGIAKGPQAAEAHVEARDLTMAFGDYVLQRDLNFTINRGDIFIIMGGSGCGKTTLMHHIVGLRQPAVGQILLNGVSLWDAAPEERDRMLHRMGVSYQSGALWSSMTLAENVALPLGEFTDLTRSEIAELVSLKLALVGLTGFEDYYPSEISGGMQKRAGLARAIALDPEIVFLDEPSAGLAPLSGRRLDDLLLELRDNFGMTVVMVTHELSSIFAVGNNSVFLDARSKTQIAAGNPSELRDHCEVDLVRAFLTRGTIEQAPGEL